MTVVHYETAESTFCFIKGEKQCERFAETSDINNGPAIKCCEIEGESWEDCMVKYHEHMGWTPYVPMGDN